ncbi:hypothetical protein GGS26DRAFT_522812 [Hypomontagnella submonticulosa]|nr:hypothetical protein GGS26DRAFT_522812 [Hypomontagnella submonticulosa]
MPCDCRRITFRFACRHKEREYHRCWRYNSKKDYPCMGVLIPACQAFRLHTNVPRVCSECYDFFVDSFGTRAAHHVSQRFLEFKEHRGLSKQALDPATVPREAYVSSYEIAIIQRAGGRNTNQPFRAVSPMRATPARAPLAEPQQPPPVVHRTRHSERSRPVCPIRAQLKSASTSTSGKKPISRKPVPTRNQDSKAVISRPVPRGIQPSSYKATIRNRGVASAAVGGPVREHATGQPIDLTDLVDDAEPNSYYQYPPSARGRPLSHSPIQPMPRRPSGTQRPRDQHSDCSLVKRITEAAETVEIAGYPNPDDSDLPSVPQIGKAPKIPAWRQDTPHPEAGVRDSRRARSYGDSLSPRRLEPLPLRTAPATFTRTKRSTESLTSRPARSPSRDVVPVPPVRTSGVRVPNSAHYYREQGVPSSAYLEESSNNDEDEEQQGRDGAYSPPAMLVSISTPSPAFSCAVQSCFCDAEDADDDVCPSCLERRRLRRRLQGKWI